MSFLVTRDSPLFVPNRRSFLGTAMLSGAAVARTVEKLGGKPVAKKASYAFATEKLKSQADVLRFAAALEKGAVSAYLNAVPMFGNRNLAQVAASILGDEAMHWAVLRQAVGENPVPGAFV